MDSRHIEAGFERSLAYDEKSRKALEYFRRKPYWWRNKHNGAENDSSTDRRDNKCNM